MKTEEPRKCPRKCPECKEELEYLDSSEPFFKEFKIYAYKKELVETRSPYCHEEICDLVKCPECGVILFNDANEAQEWLQGKPVIYDLLCDDCGFVEHELIEILPDGKERYKCTKCKRETIREPDTLSRIGVFR